MKTGLCPIPTVLASGLLAASALAQGQRLFVVDFEGFAEEIEIAAKYIPAGVTFSMRYHPETLPIIAVEGSPLRAFVGVGDDNPMPEGAAGLTDPPLGGTYNTSDDDTLLNFDPPVTSVRLYIVDIDNTDSFTVRAFQGAMASRRCPGRPW